MKRTVFFISDGTGITAENLGHSLLTQFEHVRFDITTLPYINTVEKAEAAKLRINEIHTNTQQRPIVFATILDPQIQQILAESDSLYLDFFGSFLGPLEAELNIKSSLRVGRMHGVVDYNVYMSRINAVNFTLGHDDGVNPQTYKNADIILVGVSRSGKTPTCLYLALQYGIFAANYPITEEDLNSKSLPKMLQPVKEKLFGLTIDPERLQLIRSERRPNSPYASMEQCRKEVKEVEKLFHQETIPYLNATTRSIEEISTTILANKGIRRRIL